MAVIYRVTHATEYVYEQDVSASYGELHLLPRECPGQRCLRSSVTIDPSPATLTERVDYFGNRVGYLFVDAPHRELTVTATSEVEVHQRETLDFGDQPWEHVRAAALEPDAVEYRLDSPLIAAAERYRSYARTSFADGRGIVDAIADLCHRIHSDFEFEVGATSVATPLDEVFDGRAGVCQDFAHIGIACLRSLGLPARYVSGYLETDPPEGGVKLTGADVSHAWFGVRLDADHWLDIDPTNDQRIDDRYVVCAYGRDYGDIAPLRGVIYTEGKTESLKVKVDVTAL